MLFDPGVRAERGVARRLIVLPYADHEVDVATDQPMDHTLDDRLRQAATRAQRAHERAGDERLGCLDVDACTLERRASHGDPGERALDPTKAQDLHGEADRRRENPRERGEGPRRGVEPDEGSQRIERGHPVKVPRRHEGRNALPFVVDLGERTSVRALTVLAVLLEALAKLTLLGTLFVLFVGSADPLRLAMIAACVSAATTAARTLLRGELVRRRLADVFAAVLSGLRRTPLPDLLSRRDKMTSGALFEAAFDVSSTQASAFPDALAAGLVILTILATVAVRLGPQYLLLGAAGALAMLAILAPLRKRARLAREEAWTGHTNTMRGLDALVFGAFELRGAGAEARLDAHVRAVVGRVALAERRAHWLSITSALIPAALAIAVLVVPRAWMETLLRDQLGEASVLVAAGVSATVALVTALEQLARGAPCRATLAAFLRRPVGLFAPLDQDTDAAEVPPGPPPRTIAAERFGHRYPDATSNTPGSLSFELVEHGGLAIVGPNGAGKTTTLLALTGLVESEAIRIDGEVPDAARWAALRAHACILPQRAHVVADESIGWHLSLFGARPLDETRALAGLETFGLLPLLRSRAERRGCAITELPMGMLSGGEQRRVLLARVALSDARLVLLDEPEVGLDEASRGLLRAKLAELARTRMVVLVCHHESVIPDGFAKASARPNAVERPAAAML